MAKEGFIFYRSFAEAFKGLDASQYRDIMMAITDYALDGIEPEDLDPVLYGYFMLIKPQLDANDRRRTSGKKGADTRWSDSKAMANDSKAMANDSKGMANHSKPIANDSKPIANDSKAMASDSKPIAKEKVKDKDKVKDKEKDKTLSPSSDDDDPDLFEQFWAAYPKKVAKGDAVRAFKKTKPTKALLQTMIEAVDRGKRSAMWKRDNGRYIPNPATWLNGRRWEDDLPEDMGLPDPVAVKTRFHNFEERNDDIDAEALELSKKALGI